MLYLKNIEIGHKTNKKSKLLFKVNELSFSKNELVAVIGSNGAGKTTFFNSLLGIQEVMAGEFLFRQKNMNLLKQNDKNKLLSFVPSKFSGVNHLTVYELIAMGRSPYTNIFNRLSKEDKEIIEKVIIRLGLQELIHKNTIDLSDGERQIAMIAKALTQETAIMILDEPTAFLDYKNRRKILQLLKEIVEKENKLVFISSHDLELCFQFCTRIVAIDNHDKILLDYSQPFHKEKIIEKIFLNER